jgi:hypothetical protein
MLRKQAQGKSCLNTCYLQLHAPVGLTIPVSFEAKVFKHVIGVTACLSSRKKGIAKVWAMT